MATGTTDPTLSGTKERMEEQGYFEEGEEEMSSCSSCDGSCPETVDVTVENNSYTFSGGTIIVTHPGGTNPTIDIDIQDGDGNNLAEYCSIGLALIVNQAVLDPNDLIASAPATPGWITNGMITDDAGNASVTFSNGGLGAMVFNLVVTFAGLVEILDDPITVT